MKNVTEYNKKRDLTSFDLAGLREPWEAYCKINGISSGDALRKVIQKLTAAPKSTSSLPTQRPADTAVPRVRKFVMKESAEKRRVQLALRLSESERFAISERAKIDGFENSQQWIVALVRARLTDEPQFGTREIETLSESNRQLLAIGRNLNQIAHSLNASRGNSTVQFDAEIVENLAKGVKMHVKKVGDVLRASVYRWTLE
jgi:hypothetical protein